MLALASVKLYKPHLETRRKDKEVYESLMEFLNYQEVTWVGKQLGGDQRTPPICAVLFWNKVYL